MGDWFRKVREDSQGASIVWKAMVKAFPLLGNWAAWKSGNGCKVRIGEEPWIINYQRLCWKNYMFRVYFIYEG